MAEAFSLTVNGKPVEVEADRDTPLLYVLRNDLGLKGARFGCGQGLCGACTVILDGRAVYSCDTPLWSAAGRSVETIESIGKDGRLHPLQAALLYEQAGQCGYCLTGIVMRLKALIDADPRPTMDEVAAALERNLCRCGSQPRIIRAIERLIAQPDAPR